MKKIKVILSMAVALFLVGTVSANAQGNYYINNVVEAPVNGTVQFDYAE